MEYIVEFSKENCNYLENEPGKVALELTKIIKNYTTYRIFFCKINLKDSIVT